MRLIRSAQRTQFRERTRPPWIAALVLVTGVGPLATDAYLPALPQVRQALGTSASLTQLTMTAFIIGSAVGMLLLSPVSDGLGRRRLILAAATTFAVSSLVCALTPTIQVLIAARLVQGAASGSGAAVGLAVVSDRYEGNAAARMFGTLISINLLAPVIAPAIGAAILTLGDWRAVFLVLIAAGLLMVLVAGLGIPETLPLERRHPGGLRSTIERMGNLLGNRAFILPVLVQCLATAGFFTYIGGSSFVLQNQLGSSQQRYALIFATNAAAMTVGSICFRLSVTRTGPFLLRGIGLGTSTTASAALAVLGLLNSRPSLAPVWCLLIFTVGGMGLTVSATTAIAQEAGRRYAGAASALRGGLTFLVGALTTPLTGLIGRQTITAMASAMALFFLAATALLLGTYRDYRHTRARTPAEIPTYRQDNNQGKGSANMTNSNVGATRVREVRRRLAQQGPPRTRDQEGDFETVTVPERHCDQVRDLMVSERVEKVVEVGLAYASSALAIGEALATVARPHSRHVIVDPFQESEFRGAGWDLMCSAGLDRIATLMRTPSSIALPQLLTDGFRADAAFVDGSHRFHEVFVDLYFLRKIVRPGGLIVIDDDWWPSVHTAAQYYQRNLGWTVIPDAFPGEAIGTGPQHKQGTRCKAYRLPDRVIEPSFEDFQPF